MRWSNFFLPTLREDPKEAEAISHKLMMRAGLIRRLGSGAYTYLPLGLRALQKAIAIVREEMNRAGAQELLMPAMQPVDLWKQTGRYAILGDVLIRFKDRTGKEMALGPTHEEVVTDLLKEIKSHKQLPVTVYQIQTKFRDEPRPRSGVIRSKEFLMKDAYSFDTDLAGLDKSYQAMYVAYHRIFQRSGVQVLACEADPGMMGGLASREFMAPSESGEDKVVRCTGCDYAANLEAAQGAELPADTPVAPKPLQAVKTPGAHTVEQVSAFLKVQPKQLIKTLIYEVGKDSVAVLVRGDHDVNEAKLARALEAPQLALASPQAIQRVTGVPVGFVGPVKLVGISGGIRMVADKAVMQMANGVSGANEAETHLINVNPGRDFTPAQVADLRLVTETDRCPKCKAPLTFVRAIEVGHVFKLGTKYSQVFGAVVQDAAGKSQPMIMGCYGIGVNRIIASAIEQGHDANGIIWPTALAPFQAIISVLDAGNAGVLQAAEQAYAALQQAGLEVLFDDRDLSPGAKLKDADLIGIPVQVIFGKTWIADQQVEVCLRSTKQKQRVSLDALLGTVHKLLDTPTPRQ